MIGNVSKTQEYDIDIYTIENSLTSKVSIFRECRKNILGMILWQRNSYYDKDMCFQSTITYNYVAQQSLFLFRLNWE